MIKLFSGTPGSGKSLHVARVMYNRLNKNIRYPSVIANFSINEKMILKRKKGKQPNFIYKDNSELTVEFLVQYALENHTAGKENQTLVVVDECQVKWNAREWQNNSDRLDWIKFFTMHRHLGYDFILVTQNDRMIDRQIRALIEYQVIHRKVNNFKIGKILPFPCFASIEYWYGINERLESEFFIYRKKWGQFYDSYGRFHLDETVSKLGKKEKGLGVPSPSPSLENS
ncbi:MAG: zonular occludens toxin domain-containing protein [Clostridiaceae bacterium]